jgi:hypothetical protein
MAVLSALLTFFLATIAVNVNAAPTSLQLQERGIISNADIVGFAQTVPDGTEGTLYLAYQPYLYVVNGCVPFPGVDAAGDTKYVPYPKYPLCVESQLLSQCWASPNWSYKRRLLLQHGPDLRSCHNIR